MFIKTVHLENFKRFTDLSLDLSRLEPPPKLVLLIGANGSGKTSIFDAFSLLSKTSAKDGHSLGGSESFFEYYKKFNSENFETRIEFTQDKYVEQVNGKFSTNMSATNAFYGRSALRQIPKLQKKGRVNGINISADQDRPKRYIDRDERFENDIDAIALRILEEVFDADSFDSRQLREKFIEPLNGSLKRIFGPEPATSLILERLIPSLQNEVADIRFRKGNSDIHYDLLSSGEKEVFNILLNLFNRREFYTDSIYFIDELDVHLNTALQYTLLKEIVENWIPDGCQLWTASHSLGFIQYAQETNHSAILDFDQYDFDLPRTLTPEPKDSTEIYEIAVPIDVLPVLFEDKQIIFCENQDALLYQGLKLSQKVFTPLKDKNSVYFKVKDYSGFSGLMDRDYLTPDEIERIHEKYPRLFILDLYSIESYLYHPQNFMEAVPDFDIDAYMAELLKQKNQCLLKIVAGIRQARGGYQVIHKDNEPNIAAKDAVDQIIEALESNVFEEFYPYFDMKTVFDRSSVEHHNRSKAQLARTNWFRNQISTLLNK